mgnify:CR=1 FL=1|jgi:hypothetical protein
MDKNMFCLPNRVLEFTFASVSNNHQNQNEATFNIVFS